MNTKERIISLLESTDRTGIENVIEHLRESDFFKAPASTKYHNNFVGGLADHSLKVRDLFFEKIKRFNINISESSANIAALLHDFCKIGFYKVDESTGKYFWKDEFPIGHGEKSVILLQDFIALTKQEIALMRWHMGIYEDYVNKRAFYNAINIYPEIIALANSDMESSKFLEITKK